MLFNRRSIISTCVLVALSTPSFAARNASEGIPDFPAWPANPAIGNAEAMIKGGDIAGAQTMLREALVKDPSDADLHNMYAFSIRKGPNPDMATVFKHYNEALRIKPDHVGAHEYLGEAYLMAGNVAKAKEQLVAVRRYCKGNCPEAFELNRHIAEYEARGGKK